MIGSKKPYRRLPGLGRQVQSYTRLWLGADHLLWVESTGFSERYKRFYFRDIQAIIIRKTDRGKIMNYILGSLAGIGYLIGWSAGAVWSVFFGFMGSLFLLILFSNWLLGPTCVCYLRPAVQTEELKSLNRLRTARKVLRRLQPQLTVAQGIPSAEELPIRQPESEGGQPPAAAIPVGDRIPQATGEQVIPPPVVSASDQPVPGNE